MFLFMLHPSWGTTIVSVFKLLDCPAGIVQAKMSMIHSHPVGAPGFSSAFESVSSPWTIPFTIHSLGHWFTHFPVPVMGRSAL